MSKLLFKNPLVSINWVKDALASKSIKVLDCTLNSYTEAQKLFLSEHLPSADWFSIHRVSQQDPTLPYLLPTESDFQNWMNYFGIGNEDTIVVYDRLPSPSSARVWWTFKVFGHNNVYIMNGGLTQWKESNFPTESLREEREDTPPHNKVFSIKKRQKMIYNYDDIKKNIVSQLENPERPLLIDARPPTAFQTAHIPGAVNVPVGTVFDNQSTGMYRQKEIISQQFEEVLKDHSKRNPNKAKEIVLYCNSAITACVLEVALSLSGIQNAYHFPEESDYHISIYDGSWSDFILRE